MDDHLRKLVFSHKKKFKIDGSDSFKYFRYDLWKKQRSIVSCQSGDGSVTIWACSSYYGKSRVAFLNSRQNSMAYCNTLQNYLLEFGALNHGNICLFQQHNSPIHFYAPTRQWFSDYSIDIISWLARYPDPNIAESNWDVLIRALYSNGTQYGRNESAKRAILHEKSLLEDVLLQKLCSQ